MANNDAYRQAIQWVKTEHAEKWAQLLGDAREKHGLPRARAIGQRHGTFKAWVKHIERGDPPCRLCAEAFEAKTTPLVRASAEPASGPDVLQCEDCDFTVDAVSPTRRQAMAMHVRKRHNRALRDSEAKPVAREVAA